MADKSYLAWPFFDSRHADLEAALDAWAEQTVRGVHGHDVDADCRQLVRLLGEGGWLRHAIAAEAEAIDTRAICLIRETLARHNGLADFACMATNDFHRAYHAFVAKQTPLFEGD
jgi:acyl-CoA dehydrogenase